MTIQLIVQWTLTNLLPLVNDRELLLLGSVLDQLAVFLLCVQLTQQSREHCLWWRTLLSRTLARILVWRFGKLRCVYTDRSIRTYSYVLFVGMWCSALSNLLFDPQSLEVKALDRKMYGKFCINGAYIVLLVKLIAKLTHCFLMHDTLRCG